MALNEGVSIHLLEIAVPTNTLQRLCKDPNIHHPSIPGTRVAPDVQLLVCCVSVKEDEPKAMIQALQYIVSLGKKW